jgi:hypothetical protein
MTTPPPALGVIAFGVQFRLLAQNDAMLRQMLACVPWSSEVCPATAADAPEFALRTGTSPESYRLHCDRQAVAENSSLGAVLEELRTRLVTFMADSAPDRIFLHAGVAGWQGRAIVLPGAAFAGKTTLVAELVRAGATYYSDEYAVLDSAGLVHPYARALQMRHAGSSVQQSVAIEELGGTTGTAALPVAHVLFTEYRPGACWHPEPVSAGMAVLEMMRHTIPVQRSPARAMASLAKMMETAQAVRSARGEASALARMLLKQ